MNKKEFYDSRIKNNTIHKTAASSTLNPGNEPIVEYNNLYESGYLQSDGAMIHCMVNQQPNVKIRYNWVHDTIKYGIRFDGDGDGYGDNWGDPSWNASRDSEWPGIFVEGASSPDKCPDSPTTNVDDEGCSKSERDTDQDGVNDLLDNCPEQPKGPDGYDDGCPLPVSETDDGETMILGMTLPVFGGVLAGGIVVLVLLTMVIGRLRNRGYDFDDDEDDDDFGGGMMIPATAPNN